MQVPPTLTTSSGVWWEDRSGAQGQRTREGQVVHLS